MKKLYLLSLVLVMAVSLVSGTLAMYTTELDNLASGSVTAKEFIFTGSGTDSFQQGVKIAPSETVRWQFGVKNFENQLITETDLYYKLTFTVRASDGKQAIDPLTVTVRDASGDVLKSVTGTGSFDIFGSFPLSQIGQERLFVVEISWPAGGSDDINYAGGGFGTTVRVDAAASQLPFEDGGGQPGAVSVRYETTPAWSNGQGSSYEYNYKITITNNSDTAIEDWRLSLSLANDKIKTVWSNARLVSKSGGDYIIENPAYNNTATDDILPGRSVSFGGSAQGRGTEAITGVTVSGSNADPIGNVSLTCLFNREITW